MKLNDRTFDILKWICLIALPSTAWLYDELGVIWGFPYVDEITKSINIIATFLGIILGISTLQYNKEKWNQGEELLEEDGIGGDETEKIEKVDVDLPEELTEEEIKEGE